MKIKASGGIRDYHTARAMIEAGADRLGVSAGVAIAEGETMTPSEVALFQMARDIAMKKGFHRFKCLQLQRPDLPFKPLKSPFVP